MDKKYLVLGILSLVISTCSINSNFTRQILKVSKRLMGLGKVILADYEAEKNGKKIKYVIENLATESEILTAIEHMKTFFIPREPLCSLVGLKDDPISVKSFASIWLKSVSGGTGIGAYLINNDGSKGNLIGVNMTSISKKDEKDDEEYEGKTFKTVFDGVVLQAKCSKLYEKYNVDEYLNALGLSVDSDFHGYQLGRRILQSRKELCKHLNIKTTATMFTAGASKHLAAKLGYETVLEWDYKEFKVNDTYPFADMWEKLHEKSSKIMAYQFK